MPKPKSDKFNFGCLMSEKLQIKLREASIQCKKTDKSFSQAKIVEIILKKAFKDAEREGIEFIVGCGKKTIDI